MTDGGGDLADDEQGRPDPELGSWAPLDVDGVAA